MPQPARPSDRVRYYCNLVRLVGSWDEASVKSVWGFKPAKRDGRPAILPMVERLILIREGRPKNLVDVDKLADGRTGFDFLLKETLRLQ